MECPYLKCCPYLAEVCHPCCCPLINHSHSQDIQLGEGTKIYLHTHFKDEKVLSFRGGQLLVVQCGGCCEKDFVLVPGLIVAYHFGTKNNLQQSCVLPVSKTLRSEVETVARQFGFKGVINLW